MEMCELVSKLVPGRRLRCVRSNLLGGEVPADEQARVVISFDGFVLAMKDSEGCRIFTFIDERCVKEIPNGFRVLHGDGDDGVEYEFCRLDG